MSKFSTPKVCFSRNNWGPTELPKQYLNVPYAPFGKGDRLGKAADFTSHYSYRNKYGRHDPSGTNAEFQYKHDAQEDMSFQLVDTIKSGKSRVGNFRPFPGRPVQNKFNQQKTRRQPSHQTPSTARVRGQQQQNKRWDRLSNARRLYGRRKGDRKTTDRMASVNVESNWKVIDQFDLSQLTKLQANPPTVTDLKWCGELHQYDDIYDRISTRSEKPLRRYDDREFYYVSTTDDPVIEDIATDGTANVFATDAILAHLMACTRSVYPWDIVVQRVGSSVFFDKRDNSKFDLVTVNETAFNPPSADEEDSINHPDKLSIEATMINQNFTQQVLKPGKPIASYEYPHPFKEEGTEPAAYAYRYRLWDLGNEIKLVARCELHGVAMKRDEKQLITAYALNEWDSKLSGGVDWRKKIDAQRGAVLATELKNNSCKLGKWTAQSILAGADQMKLGYVSRTTRNDPYSHVVLGTHTYTPGDFAVQIAMNSSNMWGIIKMLVELFLEQPEGKYVIMKDPNKPLLRIYSVPLEAFDEDTSDEE